MTMTATIDRAAVATKAAVATDKIHVSGKGALTGLLADLALTASHDDGVTPELTLLRLHTDDGRLHGWSTDRYRMAHSAVDVDGELPGVVYMEAADAKRLSAAMRTAHAVTMRVDTDTGRLEFSDYEQTVAFPASRPLHDPAPVFSRVAKDELPANAVMPHFQARYLEDFGKIGKRRGEPISFATDAERRPTHIRIGADYRAWLMPYREAEDARWLPSTF